MSRSSALRWSLAALVVVIALIVAIWPRGGDEATGPSSYDEFRNSIGTATQTPSPSSDADLDGLRAAAGLLPCPTPSPGVAGAGPLAGILLTCLADGSPVDLGSALAGKPALINLWAYWCGPCAEELPFLQQYAERAGGAVTVLTVHEDPKQDNALTRLTDYGVRLPGVQDGSARVAAAVAAPSVLPVSVLVAADGSIAKVLPQPFRSVDDVAAAVTTYLGVTA
ncbi:TlpA family protein disulfide reductase [Actinomycetes bacterium M1A6_2h]